jgi:uncharacterized membrane protein YeaQ/YmgE (transglycosylase-associated protein family)
LSFRDLPEIFDAEIPDARRLNRMLYAIIIGLIAGWLTGKLMSGGGYGIFADILLGLIGAVIGSWIFNSLGIVVNGGIGYLAMATVGAIVLVGLVHLIRSPSSAR